MSPHYTLISCMALLTAASLSRADNTPPPLVTTTGNSEVKVVPDLADLRFDIELRNTNLKTALAQEAEKMSQLVAALKAAGIGERDLQTSQVTINPVYQQENGTYAETAKIAFFSVSQTVGCTLRDIQKITAITTRAIDAGANRVSGVTLRTSKLRQYRDQARVMAVKAAKEKALALAGELGSKVGKPHSITEQSSEIPTLLLGNSFAQNAAAAPGDSGSNSPFEPGTISISATVTVAFVLE